MKKVSQYLFYITIHVSFILLSCSRCRNTIYLLQRTFDLRLKRRLYTSRNLMYLGKKRHEILQKQRPPRNWTFLSAKGTSSCKAHFSRKRTSLHDSSIYWMFASHGNPSGKTSAVTPWRNLTITLTDKTFFVRNTRRRDRSR